MEKIKEKMKPELPEVQKNLKSGYPDYGNGFYAREFNYGTWFYFN